MLKKIRTKLKENLDTRFPNWDISIALRYLPIVSRINKNYKAGQTILEVGSEIEGITPYLQKKVTGLDRGFDYSRRSKLLEPVVGSADKLPFPDQSYDYVLSVDMLEHLPVAIRTKAINEMLRVARNVVYLTFPCGAHSESVDRLLNDYFYDKNGYHFSYLEEHVELGLPPCDLVSKIVNSRKDWSLTELGNTSSWLWVFLLKFGLSNTQWKTSLYRRLLFLLPVLKHLNFGKTYRKLYILKRVA